MRIVYTIQPRTIDGENFASFLVFKERVHLSDAGGLVKAYSELPMHEANT